MAWLQKVYQFHKFYQYFLVLKVLMQTILHTGNFFKKIKPSIFLYLTTLKQKQTNKKTLVYSLYFS